MDLVSRSTKQPLTSEEQGFNYTALNCQTRIVVQKSTSQIKNLIRGSAKDRIEIGKIMLEV